MGSSGRRGWTPGGRCHDGRLTLYFGGIGGKRTGLTVMMEILEERDKFLLSYVIVTDHNVVLAGVLYSLQTRQRLVFVVHIINSLHLVHWAFIRGAGWKNRKERRGRKRKKERKEKYIPAPPRREHTSVASFA